MPYLLYYIEREEEEWEGVLFGSFDKLLPKYQG